MLNDLDKEARKTYYKVITIDDFRTLIRIAHIPSKIFVTTMGKSIDRISKGDLTTHIEKHIDDKDSDQITEVFNAIVIKKIKKSFKQYLELEKYLKDKVYTKLTNEDFKKIESYREPYEKCNFPLSFDNLIKLICKSDPEEKTKKELNGLKSQIDSLNKQLKEKQAQIEELSDKNEKSKQSLKKKEKEYKTVSKQFDDFKKRLTVKDINLKLSDILDLDNTAINSYDELYAELNVLENKALTNKSYNELLKILAAKFAVCKVMKGSKENESI